MTSDFSAPFVAAQIVTQDGNKYPFWTNLSGDDTKRSASNTSELRAMAWLQEVNVEMGLDEIPKLSVTLAPPFREGMAFLNSPLIYYGVSTLEVQFGYVQGTGGRVWASPTFKGTIWQPEISIAPGEIQISLPAHGGRGGSDLVVSEGARVAGLTGKGGARKVNSRETRQQLMLRILNDTIPPRGYTIEWDPPEWEHKDDIITNWAQGGLTDWAALKLLARGARCDVRLDTENKIVKLISVSKILKAPPSRVFKIYDYPDGKLGKINSEEAIYPVLSLSSVPAYIFAPSIVQAAVMSELSEKDPRGSKTAAPTLITESETSDKALSAKAKKLESSESNTEVDKETGNGGERFPGDPESEEAYKFCKGEYEKHAHMGVRFDVGSIGVPDLMPRDVIKMDVGIHRISTQAWSVHAVKHSIGLGGFDTNFTVFSNTDSLVLGGFEGLNKGEDVKGEPNDLPVDSKSGVEKESRPG
jgi:hypothetical protein